MDWKARVALLTGNVVVIAGALLGLTLLVGECRDFRGDRARATAPVVAPPTKAEQKAEQKVLPCRDVQAIEPGARARQRIAEKYHRPDLVAPPDGNARAFELGVTRPPAGAPAEILGERQIPPAPAGGTALVTLEPDGRVEITVVAAPEKLIEWKSTYEAGALYGVGHGGDTRGRGWVAVEPLRFARLHLRVEAGVDLRAGSAEPYAMVGVVWRSR